MLLMNTRGEREGSTGLLCLATLLLLIVPGNLLTIRLFFGVDFIFGNIFVFLIAFLFGPLWAVLAGAISSLTTYFIWNHFMTAPIFIAEALAVALIFKKRQTGNPVEYVALFWFLIGAPLGFLIYKTVMGMAWNLFLMTLVKQCLNSLFSASMAGLVLSMPWLPFRQKKRKLIPVYDLFSSLLIISLVSTVLVILVMENRDFEKRSLGDVKRRTIHTNAGLETYVKDWKNRNQHLLFRMSYQLSSFDPDQPDDHLQGLLELFYDSVTDFDSLYVTDKEGRSTAFAPRYNREGETNIGRSFSQQEYFLRMQTSVTPLFSRVRLSEETREPVIGVGAPIRLDGEFKGVVMGGLLLKPLEEMLREYQASSYQHITLIDSRGQVIISTDDYQPLDLFETEETGARQVLGDGVFQWLPDDEPSSMQSYKKSHIYYKSFIPELNWTLYIKETLERQADSLIRKSLRNNVMAIFLILILIPLMKIAFFGFRKSLNHLLEVSSRHFDEHIREEDWPVSSIQEFNNLISRVKRIMETQKENSLLMKEQNRKLSGMNAALVRSEENLRTTLNSIGDGVIVTDAEGRIVTLNPVATLLSGWSYDASLNRKVESIMHLKEEFSGMSPPDPFENVLRKGESLVSGKPYLMEDLNGVVHTVTLGAEPIRLSHESEIRGTVIIIRDISQTRRLESQLRQAQKMEVVGQLAGGIAHDFNNLLAGIVGLNEMILSGLPEDSPARESSRAIGDLVAKAADLTRKLLAFSRKGKMTSKVFNLHKVIEDTVEILRRTIDKSIRIDTDLEAKSFDIAGDPTQIQSVFMNIALNAGDAMPGGGSLIFRTTLTKGMQSVETTTGIKMISGPHIRVSISDTGSGIDQDALPHIFEPFFTTKGIGKGSGMGLSAVFGAISEHNGMITVDSELGQGSSFHIYFPIAQSSKLLYEPQELAIMRREETILVIDDEEIIRNSLRAILTELGYNVLTADGGNEGLKQYKEKTDTISLIILDAVMTDMPGIEVLKALKDFNPLVRVIIATGYSSESRGDQFREAGAMDFIPKPFTIDDLNSRIRRALNR